MWEPLLEPGVALLAGGSRSLRSFAHALAQETLQIRDGAVLWCDGAHGFNPYEFAELNLTQGLEADAGASRMLIKRCMTAFQWDTVLTKHLDEKLLQTPTDLVLVAPYDRLFVHEELQDWEQEDYVRFSLRHLKYLARKHRIPIVLTVNMDRWWRTHPVLAQETFEQVQERWTLSGEEDNWRLERLRDGFVVQPRPWGRVTLLDFLEDSVPTPLRPPSSFIYPP